MKALFRPFVFGVAVGAWLRGAALLHGEASAAAALGCACSGAGAGVGAPGDVAVPAVGVRGAGAPRGTAPAVAEPEGSGLSSSVRPPAGTNVREAQSTDAAGARRGRRIPHNLMFTYKYDIFRTQQPPNIYANVQRTVDAYRSAWAEPDATVYMLTDDDCRRYIRAVEPRLIPHFDEETKGMYKADICRVAALYEVGGYYFDVDMKLANPLILDDDVSFATPVEYNRWQNATAFFQSFLAVEPRSKILERTLEYMLGHYNGTRPLGKLNVGTNTLRHAFDVTPPDERGRALILREIKLTDGLYPELERQKGHWRYNLCNFVVHDPDKGEVYFFSRGLDLGKWCRTQNQVETASAHMLVRGAGKRKKNG